MNCISFETNKEIFNQTIQISVSKNRTVLLLQQSRNGATLSQNEISNVFTTFSNATLVSVNVMN
jgi:hypothetical protein